MTTKKFTSPNIYNEGDMVYAKEFPSVKLVIRRYLQRIYYCRIAHDTLQKEQVYFENELFSKKEETI